MKEYGKTAVLWLLVGGVCLVTCWIALTAAPPLFTSEVHQGVDAESSWETVSSFIDRLCKLDLNGATVNDFMRLPGMTTELAREIARTRDVSFPYGFLSPSDLLTVDGVTEELFASWEPLVYCG